MEYSDWLIDMSETIYARDAEIAQLRAELAAERELADRLAGLLSRAPTKAVYMQLCIEALATHATRRNK